MAGDPTQLYAAYTSAVLATDAAAAMVTTAAAALTAAQATFQAALDAYQQRRAEEIVARAAWEASQLPPGPAPAPRRTGGRRKKGGGT